MYRVLLLCKDNSTYSPMAEAYLRQLSGDFAEIYSAGLEKSYINPAIRTLMREEGMDLSSKEPHSLLDYRHLNFDFVLTFDTESENESHHLPSSSVKYHYNLETLLPVDNLTEESLDATRHVRDVIKKTMQNFAKEHLINTKAS